MSKKKNDQNFISELLGKLKASYSEPEKKTESKKTTSKSESDDLEFQKQLEAMLTAKAPKEVRVFDMNTARAEAFAAKMQEKLARYGAKIRAAATSGEAVRGADLLITVTPSGMFTLCSLMQ